MGQDYNETIILDQDLCVCKSDSYRYTQCRRVRIVPQDHASHLWKVHEMHEHNDET